MDKFPLFQRNYEDFFHFSKNKEADSLCEYDVNCTALYRAREVDTENNF